MGKGSQPKIPDLLDVVRRLIEQGFYLETRHAQDRMRECNIIRLEVQHVLRNGVRQQAKDEFDDEWQTWKYAIRGQTLDSDRRLRLIVSIVEPGLLPNRNVNVITVIDLDE